MEKHEAVTDRVRLQRICDVLNEQRKRMHTQELRDVIAKWQKSPSLHALLRDDPGLGWDLDRVPGYFEPSKTGKGGSFQIAPKVPDKRAPHTFTIWMFGYLVTNPLCEKLAGPCGRCGRYYLKKRVSQKVYCSRRCGNAATAVARTRQRLREERDEKLRRATAAILKWKSLNKPSREWKTWVAEREHLTTKFLSRAVTRRDLVPPEVEKTRKSSTSERRK